MLRPVDRRKKNKPKGNPLSQWLNQIQQDSWQLELVISGIVIFLLLGTYEPLENFLRHTQIKALAFNHALDIMTMIGGGIVLYATSFITLGFLCHLILRGFWIGAISLRSVSGDFDFEALNFTPRYDQWLRKRLGSFDQFIERLEMRSSIAFSLAFMLFFVVLSVGLFMTVIVLFSAGMTALSQVFDEDGVLTIIVKVITVASLILLLIGALLYMIDFFTLGALKRKRFVGKIYYPIYRLMGYITLAGLYRPFYYNLIDHPFGRRLIRWIFPIVLISFAVTELRVSRGIYTPQNEATLQTIRAGNYLTAGDEVSLGSPSLATYYPETDYLELFMPTIGKEVNQTLAQRFPGLKTTTHYQFGLQNIVDVYRPDVSADSLLQAHRAIHQVYLNDSLLADTPWKFYLHPQREQHGLVYALPIYELPRGEHCLRFERLQEVKRDSLGWGNQGTLCFVR